VSTEADVLATSAAWDAALVANDAQAVAAFMADEWVYVSDAGVTPKADIIGWIADGRLAHHSMELVGPARVLQLGEAVVVTARKRSSGTWESRPYTADEWITEVFVRRRGRLTAVLSHKSRARG
jgi:ketosteroid isomerase-like protein